MRGLFNSKKKNLPPADVFSIKRKRTIVVYQLMQVPILIYLKNAKVITEQSGFEVLCIRRESYEFYKEASLSLPFM